MDIGPVRGSLGIVRISSGWGIGCTPAVYGKGAFTDGLPFPLIVFVVIGPFGFGPAGDVIGIAGDVAGIKSDGGKGLELVGAGPGKGFHVAGFRVGVVKDFIPGKDYGGHNGCDKNRGHDIEGGLGVGIFADSVHGFMPLCFCI